MIMTRQKSGRREFLRQSIGGALVAAAAPIACASAPESRTWGPYVVAMTNATPAVLSGNDVSVFQLGRPIAIPIKPRPEGLASTRSYRHPVWITPDQLRIQLSYVISSLEDHDVSIELLVDGWNGSYYYQPQMRLVEEGFQADRSCVDRLVVVPAKGRLEGRVSFDDFERMAVALAAIGNTESKPPNPFHLLDPTTKLYESPLSKQYIPAVIESILGFDLSLRSTAAVRVAVEATVEARERDEVLMAETEEANSPNRQRNSYGRTALIPVIATPAP
jgi:hypothetical protein